MTHVQISTNVSDSRDRALGLRQLIPADVCGGFPLRYSDRNNIETIVTENEKHEKIVKQLLDGELTVHDPTPDDVKIFTKLTNNYKACMDGKRLRDEHHSGVKNVFGRLKALFPVSASDIAANALMLPADYRHLADLMMYTNDLGTDILLQFDVDRIESATVSLRVCNCCLIRKKSFLKIPDRNSSCPLYNQQSRPRPWPRSMPILLPSRSNSSRPTTASIYWETSSSLTAPLRT